MRNLIVILFTLSSFVLFAKNSKNAKKLSKISTQSPMLNETVQISPTEGHHFNLKAPQKCVKSSSDKENTINPTAKKIKCQYHSPGEKKITVSVCDDKEVYCKQEKYIVNVSSHVSKEPRMKKSMHAAVAKDQKANKEKLMPGFKITGVEEAKRLAQFRNGLLVLVSTEWCPPCNMLKEFLLPTDEFKRLSQNYQLIYADGDGPLVSDWKKVAEVAYFPTFVVFNRDMEVIDVMAGYPFVHEFQEFITKATSNLKDPIKKLEKRVEDRVAGKKMRKLLDTFSSQSTLLADESRWLDYLSMIGKDEDQLKYLQKFTAKDYSQEIARIKYETFDPEKDDLKDLEKIENDILNNPLKGKDFLNDYTFASAMKKRCQNYLDKLPGNKKMKDDKNTKPKKDEMPQVSFSDEKCKAYYGSLIPLNLKLHQEGNKQLSQAETIISQAGFHRKNSSIYKTTFRKSRSKDELAACLKQYDQLEAFTPLKEKSRAVGIYRSYCVDREDTEKNLELVLKLAKNYPYDSTFHSKLARLYFKKEDYTKALEWTEKALTYSYGVNWLRAVLQKSKILKKQKKKRAAFNTLKEALNDIVYEKDNKRTYWQDTLRKEYETLKSELKL
jgi:thiol-disulfide isomerase/thioredoxin